MQHSSQEPAERDLLPARSREETILWRVGFNVIFPGNSIRLSFPMSGRNCWVPKSSAAASGWNTNAAVEETSTELGVGKQIPPHPRDPAHPPSLPVPRGNQPLPTSLLWPNPTQQGHKSRVFPTGKSCPVRIPGIFTGRPGRKQGISQKKSKEKVPKGRERTWVWPFQVLLPGSCQEK